MLQQPTLCVEQNPDQLEGCQSEGLRGLQSMSSAGIDERTEDGGVLGLVFVSAP